MVAFSIGVIVLSGLLGRELRNRARMEAHLALLADTDGLTGLLNRRALEAQLEREGQRAELDGCELCVLFADVDYFKKFNDLQGHPAGDRALVRVAEAMAQVSRRFEGRVGRYGGEEFMAVLVQSNSQTALHLAHEIRMAVEALAIAHPGSSFGVVTVSIGVATMAQVAGRSMTSLVKAADTALYAAKDAGRNSVRSFGTA